jgi:hypothetical protein
METSVEMQWKRRFPPRGSESAGFYDKVSDFARGCDKMGRFSVPEQGGASSRSLQKAGKLVK